MVSNKKVGLFRGDLTMPFHSIQQIILVEFDMACFLSTGFKSFQYFKIFRIHDGLVLRQYVFYPNRPRYIVEIGLVILKNNCYQIIPRPI